MIRRGFSLIEIVAVLTVMAIAAGVVSWTVMDAQNAAQLDDAIDRIRFTDHQIRSAARRLDREMTLRFDLRAQSILRIETDDSQGAPTYLPRGFRIAGVRTAEGKLTDSRVDIRINDRGLTQSYALLLAHEQDGETLSSWIFIAGSTGQLTAIASERQLNEVFDLIIRNTNAQPN